MLADKIAKVTDFFFDKEEKIIKKNNNNKKMPVNSISPSAILFPHNFMLRVIKIWVLW